MKKCHISGDHSNQEVNAIGVTNLHNLPKETTRKKGEPTQEEIDLKESRERSSSSAHIERLLEEAETDDRQVQWAPDLRGEIFG